MGVGCPRPYIQATRLHHVDHFLENNCCLFHLHTCLLLLFPEQCEPRGQPKHTRYRQIFQHEREVRGSEPVSHRGHTCCQQIYFAASIRTVSRNPRDGHNTTRHKVPNEQKCEEDAEALPAGEERRLR